MLSLVMKRLLGFINIFFRKFREHVMPKIWDRRVSKAKNQDLNRLNKDKRKIERMNRIYKNNKMKSKTYIIVKYITPIGITKINPQPKVIYKNKTPIEKFKSTPLNLNNSHNKIISILAIK